jgi:integrase
VLLAELTVGQVRAMFTAIIRQHQALGAPGVGRGLDPDPRYAARRAERGDPARADQREPGRPGGVAAGAPAAGGGVDAVPGRAVRRSGERPAVAVRTAEQTAQFLASAQDHRLYAACHLIALRGLRRGEAAGLRRCDVDLDGKTAVISQQLQQYDGRLAVCPPKTPHSVRVIALDRTTVTALAEHWDRQRAEAAAHGPGYRASGYRTLSARTVASEQARSKQPEPIGLDQLREAMVVTRNTRPGAGAGTECDRRCRSSAAACLWAMYLPCTLTCTWARDPACTGSL